MLASFCFKEKYMNYEIFDDYILIKNDADFNIKHVLECGQVFRFKVQDFGYTVYSLGQKADIYCQKGTTKIFTKNKKYFIKYFDLDTNYAIIKSMLKEQLPEEIKFGYGIHILNQAPLETIISFIISANNNIPRIKKTIEAICEGFGENCGDYYAFPTLSQLSKITEDDFKKMGCGYRSGYLVDTIKRLQSYDLNKLYDMPTVEARKELMSFKGIGRKVADCILLFGYHKGDVFPADVWIVKVYEDEFGKSNISPIKISEYYANRFGNLSGIAQQYMYYAKRK